MVAIIIIGVILVLILGYFFITKFEKIDNYFFGGAGIGYQSFGKSAVLLCAISGAIITCCMLYDEFTNQPLYGHSFTSKVQTMCGILILGSIGYSVYQCCSKMKTIPRIIGKIFFMFLSCIVGAQLGALGCVVTLFIILVMIVLYFVFGVRSGSTSSKSKNSVYNDEADSLESERQGLLHDDNASQYEVDNFNDRVNSHNNNLP